MYRASCKRHHTWNFHWPRNYFGVMSNFFCPCDPDPDPNFQRLPASSHSGVVMRLAQHFACANGIAICIKSTRDSIGQGACPRHFLLFSGRVMIRYPAFGTPFHWVFIAYKFLRTLGPFGMERAGRVKTWVEN